jgi:hypothetical protein
MSRSTQFRQPHGRGDVEVDDLDVEERFAATDACVERGGGERTAGGHVGGVDLLHALGGAQVCADGVNLGSGGAQRGHGGSRRLSSALISRSKPLSANCLASSSPIPLDAPVTRASGLGRNSS